MAPLLETNISRKILADDFGPNNNRFSLAGDDSLTIGNREAVIILNPTKYTVHDDDKDTKGVEQDFEEDMLQSQSINSSADEEEEAKHGLSQKLLNNKNK